MQHFRWLPIRSSRLVYITLTVLSTVHGHLGRDYEQELDRARYTPVLWQLTVAGVWCFAVEWFETSQELRRTRSAGGASGTRKLWFRVGIRLEMTPQLRGGKRVAREPPSLSSRGFEM